MDEFANAQKVFDCLDKLSIAYEKIEHPPVTTIEQAVVYWAKIDAAHCKNLFLRDDKGKNHFLVIMPHEKQFNIKSFAKNINSSRLSFASEERMKKYLGLQPGYVSPFGLINDLENHVKVYVDEELKLAENLSFHPNRNTATIIISLTDFEKFLDWAQNNYSYKSLNF